MNPRIVSLATAVPPHAIPQTRAKEFSRVLFEQVLSEDRARLLSVFDHSGIACRNVCAPLEWYAQDHSFGEKNALYVENAVTLGAEVAQATMSRAGLTVRDIDHLVFVSSTGIAAPSVDARLTNVLGLRGDVRRTPIWGLGCAGGVAGLARARDFALAEPGARVLLIALELCSLTFQRNDLSKRNLVAASLFGDGAAAALVVAGNGGVHGNGRRPLELVATSSTLWPDTLDVMGWDVDGEGLHVVFARDIPTIVHERVRPGLTAFLERPVSASTRSIISSRTPAAPRCWPPTSRPWACPRMPCATRARCCATTAISRRPPACSCSSASSTAGSSAPARARCSPHSGPASVPNTR